MKGIMRIICIIAVVTFFICGTKEATILDTQRQYEEHKMVLTSIARDRYYDNRVENDFYISGNYKNGLLQGVVSIKDRNGMQVYLGCVYNGIYEGHGIITYKEKVMYEGNFKNGLYDGWGKEHFYKDNKLIWIYEGEFKNGKKNGNGKLILSDNIISGNFKNDYIADEKYKTYLPLVPNIPSLMMEPNYNVY